jgi:hypothetical protein
MTDEYSERYPTGRTIPNGVYELRVHGRLDQPYTPWFEDMTLEIDDTVSPPQTIIRGRVRDPSALYGLIARVRDLNLTLLSVKRLEQKEDS